jgi:hypothetical protein
VPKIIQWVCNTSFRVYKKSFGLHNAYNHMFDGHEKNKGPKNVAPSFLLGSRA